MTFCSLGFSSCCSSNRGRKRLKQNYRGGRRSTALHGFWTKTAGTLRTQQRGSAGTWCQHSPRLSAVLVFVLATCPSVWSRDGQTDRQKHSYSDRQQKKKNNLSLQDRRTWWWHAWTWRVIKCVCCEVNSPVTRPPPSTPHGWGTDRSIGAATGSGTGSPASTCSRALYSLFPERSLHTDTNTVRKIYQMIFLASRRDRVHSGCHLPSSWPSCLFFALLRASFLSVSELTAS